MALYVCAYYITFNDASEKCTYAIYAQQSEYVINYEL